MKNKTQSKRYAISYPYLSSPSIFVNQFTRVVLGITGKTAIRILLGSGHFSANQKSMWCIRYSGFLSALSPGSLRIRVVALFFSALRYLFIIIGLILLVAFSNASFQVCSIYCPNCNPDRDLFLDGVPHCQPWALVLLSLHGLIFFTTVSKALSTLMAISPPFLVFNGG